MAATLSARRACHHLPADLPEHHAARALHLLGSDPATVLQALCDGVELPPLPPRIPREIANWRARAVLELAGLLPAVEAAINGMGGPDDRDANPAHQ